MNMHFPLIVSVFASALVSLLILGCVLVCYRYDVEFRHYINGLDFGIFHGKAKQKILLVGDSRIEGLDCAKRFEGWQVLNVGVAGSTSAQALRFLEHNLRFLPHFEAAIVWTGINDVRFGQETDGIMRKIEAVSALLERTANRILLIGQFPVADNDPSAVWINARLQTINAETESIAIANGYDFLPVVTMANLQRAEVYADSIHFNYHGKQLVCAAVGRWLAAHY